MLIHRAVAVELERHEKVGLSVPGGRVDFRLVSILLQGLLGLCRERVMRYLISVDM